MSFRDLDLMKQVELSPPPGWHVFGTYAGDPDVRLEFYGFQFTETGEPIWERPVQDEAARLRSAVEEVLDGGFVMTITPRRILETAIGRQPSEAWPATEPESFDESDAPHPLAPEGADL